MKDINTALKEISKILEDQKFATLSSLKDNSIHTNLIAFVISEDKKSLFFCTTKTTRKYENIINNPNISLLIHNCTNKTEDLNNAFSLSINGYATKLKDNTKIKEFYLKTHPYLDQMVLSPTSAIFQVKINQIDLVHNFQDVQTIIMD